MRISDWSSDVCSSDLRFKASEAQHHSASLSPVPAAARAGAMASQSDPSAANASAEPRRKLGSLRMVWQHASRYPLQLVVAAIALGIAALATLAIPYQFKEMIDSGFIAGGGNVAPHFRLLYSICLDTGRAS